MHNYGDPLWRGEHSGFNHGIPLNLIFRDIESKNIESINAELTGEGHSIEENTDPPNTSAQTNNSKATNSNKSSAIQVTVNGGEKIVIADKIKKIDML